jgi:hypothetical protein
MKTKTKIVNQEGCPEEAYSGPIVAGNRGNGYAFVPRKLI